MSSRAVTNMTKRIQKSVMSGVNMVIKSLGHTTVQIVLGLIIVVYTAFLESDNESILSVIMTNPIGRLAVLGFLALLAIASPPVAILFSILIIMSYTRSSSSGFMQNENWEQQDTSKMSEPKSEETLDNKDKDKSHEEIMMDSLVSTLKDGAEKVEGSGEGSEGFSNMYATVGEEDMGNEGSESSLTGLGGLPGYSMGTDCEHSTV